MHRGKQLGMAQVLIPATYTGDPGYDPGSWLQADPVMGVGGCSGSKPARKALALSPTSPFCLLSKSF